MVWDRLLPQSCVLIISVDGREVDDALRHVKRRRPLYPLGPLCLGVVQEIGAVGLD